MTERLRLDFGANKYLLPGLKAAWGARLIINMNGDVDFVPDRQSTAGDPELVTKTVEWLANSPIFWRGTIKQAILRGAVHTRRNSPLWVAEDEQGVMVGHANSSCGYFYVAAWLFEALPDGCTTKGADLLVADIQAERANH